MLELLEILISCVYANTIESVNANNQTYMSVSTRLFTLMGVVCFLGAFLIAVISVKKFWHSMKSIKEQIKNHEGELDTLQKEKKRYIRELCEGFVVCVFFLWLIWAFGALDKIG